MPNYEQMRRRETRVHKLLEYMREHGINLPMGYDANQNVDEVMRLYKDKFQDLLWTGPDNEEFQLFKQSKGTGLGFRKRESRDDQALDAGEGTASDEDAMKHLEPFLDMKFGELGFRYLGDDKAIEAELNAFREENKDVRLRSMVGYGGDAFDGELRVFLRTFKVLNTPRKTKTSGVPEEGLVVFTDKQRTPVLVPKTSFNIKNPRNAKTRKAIVDSSLWFVLDSVDGEDELRKRPCRVERLCHLMEEKDKVVMAKPFRGRELRPSKDYAFCTQASTALAPVSRGPLYPGDKVECWIGIHVAKHFRAPTPDEHAAFVASKDREKKTRKKHAAGQGPRKKAKKSAQK